MFHVPDPHVLGHPDPLVRGMDPDPSIIKQKSKKKLDSYFFVTSFGLIIFEYDVNVPSKSNKLKNLRKISFLSGS